MRLELIKSSYSFKLQFIFILHHLRMSNFSSPVSDKFIQKLDTSLSLEDFTKAINDATPIEPLKPCFLFPVKRSKAKGESKGQPRYQQVFGRNVPTSKGVRFRIFILFL